ncbi:MAG: type II toxin-antitoxin system HicA family toxin [Candidatus Gottesmanbacteria bacterium]|nr:type II toxin-antitoxin system HicA family toxin [Candidatus Gottesmanbacteria bacterium]
MSKLGNVRPRDVIRAFKKHGFIEVKTVGSHVDLRHPAGYRTTVPFHAKTLGKGLLAKILKQSHLTIDQLRNLIK